MYSIKQKVELNHLWSKKGHNKGYDLRSFAFKEIII